MTAVDDSSVETISIPSPKELYAQSLDSWKDLWNTDRNLVENTEDIINLFVALPKKEILSKVAAIYMLIPSRWSKVLPILYCFGRAGTGKSTISKIAARMHGQTNTFNAADTFASIRISLNRMRFNSTETMDYVPDECEGAILCWDNIHSQTFVNDTKLYQMVLSGYDRGTDKIQIADGAGGVIEYYTFAPKIMSSIEEFHLDPKFSELRRRLMIMPHKKLDKFQPGERLSYDVDFLASDLLDIDTVHWEGIDQIFKMFWSSPNNCKQYVFNRQVFAKRKQSKLKLNSHISSDRWAIGIDFLATGLTLGAFNDAQDACDFYGAYWQYIDETVFSEIGATLQYIREFMYSETATAFDINTEMRKKGMKEYPIIVSPTKLKNILDALHMEGKLEQAPSNKTINLLMRDEGWTLKKQGWVMR
jgi:hypothetical protein